MNTRIIHTKIWKDDFFSSLNPTEKLLFIYYLTNERVNIIHCYEVTERELYFDTGLDKSTIAKAKEKFSESNKLQFYKNYVFLTNATRYESYKGPQNEKAKSNMVRKMPSDVIDWYFKQFDRGNNTPKHTRQIGTINHKSEIINQKEDTPNDTGIELLRAKAHELIGVKN